jgi:cystathionine gamma-synthase
VLSARNDPFWQRIRSWRRTAGAVPGPFEAWLLVRGMRTLFVRVPHQSTSAMALAQRLDQQRLCDVIYPGLASHPQHAVAARQMTGGFGGMLSIRTGGGAARALAVVKKLRVWMPATSLGGVESLIEHRASVEGPNSPTPDDLLRMSVGLEHVDDLFEDLAGALR